MDLSYEVWMLLIGWAVLMLVLWNLHRYADFLTPGNFRITLIGLSIVFALAGFYLHSQNLQKKNYLRIALFPFPYVTGSDTTITPASITLPDLALMQLKKHFTGPKEVVIRLEWIFQIANLDSLKDPAYQVRLARRLGYTVFAVGWIKAESQEWIGTVNLYRPKAAVDTFSIRMHSIPENMAAAANDLAGWVLQRIRAGAAAEANGKVLAGATGERFYKVFLAYLKGDRQTAASGITALYRQNPDNPRLAVLKAKIDFDRQILTKKDARARELLLRSITEHLAYLSDQDTTRAELALMAAEGFIWRERFNEAAHYLLRAYRHAPNDPRVYRLMAKLHYTRYRPLGFFNEIDLLKKALAIHPGDVQAIFDLAEVYVQLDRIIEAQKLLENSLRLNPEHLGLLNALGQIYVSRGLTRKIFQTYEKILKLQPGNSDAFYNLGIYYYHSGDVTTAKKFFQRAIQLDNHANSRLYLAKIAEKEGKLDSAIHYLRERIRLKSGENDLYAEEARRYLFKIMLGLGKVDSTGKVLESASSEKSEAPKK